MKTIFQLNSSETLPLQAVGGKALALMTLTRQGFPVPTGLVLTLDFFVPWIEAITRLPEWERAQMASGQALREATETLQAHCRQLRLTPFQQQELKTALEQFWIDCPRRLVAVRSSSPEEDLEDASFAGGYETTLGVPPEGIEAAIRTSFASSFDERVWVYKREHGFGLGQAGLAVVIQQQVDADSAGVAFSINPLNNCYDEILIHANHGLGETVVAGGVEPDQFVIDRVGHKLVETRLGGRGVVARLKSTGGVQQTPRSASAGASLSAAQALQVAGLAEQVEIFYQKPIDIEWAYAGEQLYLLQARPITTFLPLPDEMITPPGAPKRLYANSTLIEQGLQEPLSVLGTDFLGHVLCQVGGPVAKGAIGLDGITFTAGGGYYMNISYAFKLGMKNAALAPGSSGDPRVLAILDQIDMSAYLGGELPPRLKAIRGKMLVNMLPMAASVLGAYVWPERILQRYRAALPEAERRLQTLDDNGLSLKEQAVQLTGLLEFFYGSYGIPMILAGQIAQQRIRGLFRREAAQVQDHLAHLGVALPGNKTTEMGEWIYRLAATDTIRNYASAAEFVRDLVERRLPSEFLKEWDGFMDEFGARCPAEIDPATPRPRENPALFFEQLKDLNRSIQANGGAPAFFEEARAKREAAYQVLQALALKKGRGTARALERYYATWVKLGGYRETPKHYVVRVVDLFRQRALAMGAAFVAEGRLDRREQIFDLTLADIDQARVNPALDLRALGQERSRLIQKIRKNRRAVRIIDSRGRIYDPPRPAASAGELNGVPIAPGVARGRVKVLQSAREKPLLPGEILVARATDPGWTPLFIHARAILLEIGGALQHGAVVAREYGIPCVSGLDEITQRLQDGQWVEVDGSNGVVRILEQGEV